MPSLATANSSAVEKVYPGLASGILKAARLDNLSSGRLLSADGFEILQTWADKTIKGIPEEMRKEAAGSLFFLLEQEVTRRVILWDAKAAGIPKKDQTEDQVIQSFLSRKVAGITVAEKEVKSFYDENKEMVGGLPFDQVKESIQAFLIQQKQQDAVFDYVKNLENLKDIRIDADWVKKQNVLARDNPVDRARHSEKPTMVEFGATGCVPCDMMQPILDKLKKTMASD
ncbi:MAG: thioredoxin family protein [Desulfobacterales bacterium]|nr:thioredoxin family protein [Desulfobacterales bacterium]